VEVLARQGQIAGERSIATDDPEHGAPLAVARAPAPAGGAPVADGVDLADDAPADELLRALLDHPDELVAEHADVGVVAAHQLEVGAADAGEQHAHQRFALGRPRDLEVLAQANPRLLEPDRGHRLAHGVALRGRGYGSALGATGWEAVRETPDLVLRLSAAPARAAAGRRRLEPREHLAGECARKRAERAGTFGG
jgi:hypothetical protein